jgi:hypothetical protein
MKRIYFLRRPKPRYEDVHRSVMQQIQKYSSSDDRVNLSPRCVQSTGRQPAAIAGTHGQSSVTWRSIMKAILAALALVTLIASPTFAQSYPGEQPEQTNVSPASPNFGDNGY